MAVEETANATKHPPRNSADSFLLRTKTPELNRDRVARATEFVVQTPPACQRQNSYQRKVQTSSPFTTAPEFGTGYSAKYDLVSAPSTGIPKNTKAMVLSIAAAVLYSFCGIGVNFTNKLTLNHFPLASMLLLFQMLAGVVILFPLKAIGLVKYPDLTKEKARTLLPIALLYVGNVAFALSGLKKMSIPTYSTLKRLTPLAVILGKWRLHKQLPSNDILQSVTVILLGCLIAGLGDFAFDLKGYSCALASCTLQATYLLRVEGSKAKDGVGSTELLVYNSVLTLPFIIIACVLTGEVSHFATAYQQAASALGNGQTLFLLAFSSVAGMLLNFSLFLCTHSNTALTTTVIGSLKGVTVTALGFVLLGGVEIHAMNAIGIILNTIGGMWYSLIRVKQMRRRCNLAAKQDDNEVTYDQDVENGNGQLLPITPSEDVRLHMASRLRSIDSFLDIDAVCDDEINKRVVVRVRGL